MNEIEHRYKLLCDALRELSKHWRSQAQVDQEVYDAGGTGMPLQSVEDCADDLDAVLKEIHGSDPQPNPVENPPTN